MATHFVFGRSHFSYITDYVRDNLHWLHVPQHVSFKISTLVYKTQHDLAPQYITNLIAPSKSVTRRERLRSSKLSLIVPQHCTKFAEHMFAVAGPSIWKAYLKIHVTHWHLPNSIKDSKDIYSTSHTRICKEPSQSFFSLGLLYKCSYCTVLLYCMTKECICVITHCVTIWIMLCYRVVNPCNVI